MAEKWAKVGWDIPWAPGTRLKLHFNTIGSAYITAAQIAYVERKLEKEKRFRLISYSLPKKDGFVSRFHYVVEVADPGDREPDMQQARISAGVIAGVIITLFFLWIVKDFAEVQVQREAGKTAEKVGDAAEKAEGTVKEISKSVLAIAAVIGIAIIGGWIK